MGDRAPYPPEYMVPPFPVPEIPGGMPPPSHDDVVAELRHLVGDQEPPGDFLYHYTTLQALYGMVESKAVWCTEATHLNDRREQLEFERLLKGFVAVVATGGELLAPRPANRAGGIIAATMEFRKRLEPFIDGQIAVPKFVFSLTAEPDQLSQWRGYARGDGVAVGFCWRALRDMASRRRHIFARCDYEEFGLDRVRMRSYGDHRQQPVTERDVSSSIRQRIHSLRANEWHHRPDALLSYLQRLAYLAPVAKDQGFHEEREWRVFAAEGISDLRNFVHHPRRDRLVRRAVLEIGTGAPHATPIREVVLSPALSADPDGVARIVANLDWHASQVGHHGFSAEQVGRHRSVADAAQAEGKAVVRVSTIPLRD